jgi:hypothetical protein
LPFGCTSAFLLVRLAVAAPVAAGASFVRFDGAADAAGVARTSVVAAPVPRRDTPVFVAGANPSVAVGSVSAVALAGPSDAAVLVDGAGAAAFGGEPDASFPDGETPGATLDGAAVSGTSIVVAGSA